MAEQGPLRERRRRIVARNRAEGKVEQWGGDLRIDALIWPDVTITEVEERLPADKPPRCPASPAQVVGIELPFLCGIEDK